MTPTAKPILFSGPMVRALLDGRKAQTRRVVKSKDIIDLCDGLKGATGLAAQYTTNLPIRVNVGDRLWVREAWRPAFSAVDPWHVAVLYPCDGLVKHWGWATDADFGDWTIPKAAATGNVPSIHMPRWASRLTLTVTDVRVQRLQDISEGDAIAEGVEPYSGIDPDCHGYLNYLNNSEDGYWLPPTQSFRSLWNSINGSDAWDVNPWVAAYTFTVHRCNIDELEDDYG